MGVVGHHEAIVSHVYHLVLDYGPIERFGNWGKGLFLKVLWVTLLGHLSLDSSPHLLADLDSLGVSPLWPEGRVHHICHELGPLITHQNPWVGIRQLAGVN